MTINELITDALDASNFLLGDGIELEHEHLAEMTRRWEIFRGRLLDPAHTREEKTFEEWNVYVIDEGNRSEEPLLSVKRDGETLHVTRGIHCYVHEGYDSGGGVFVTRETKRWVNELVGSISIDEAQHDLPESLFHALVGLSRLPLTSVEAPHPLFTFGRVFYGVGSTVGQASSPTSSVGQASSLPIGSVHFVNLGRQDACPTLWQTRSLPHKALEFLLHRHATSDLNTLSDVSLQLLRAMFNDVSLSPYTDLVSKTIQIVNQLPCSAEEKIDFYSYLLRQSARHLTAYDLCTFHHRGANYPDALMLDEILAAYLQQIDEQTDLFQGTEKAPRVRRRALRQAWMLRRFYQGHFVPDLPTSPGENMRVLPDSHPRVPEEQILNPIKRKRQIFKDELNLTSAQQEILDASLDDLCHSSELRELGMALYLDRPLGAAKAPGEPDQTILLSHLAFSPSLVRQRLRLLNQTCDDEQLSIQGIPLDQLAGAQRPGTVSVIDAAQAASDFLYLRTTQSSLVELRSQYDFSAFDELNSVRLVLPVTHADEQFPVLRFYDSELTPCLELALDLSEGYHRRGAVEVIRAGLRCLQSDRRAVPMR